MTCAGFYQPIPDELCSCQGKTMTYYYYVCPHCRYNNVYTKIMPSGALTTCISCLKHFTLIVVEQRGEAYMGGPDTPRQTKEIVDIQVPEGFGKEGLKKDYNKVTFPDGKGFTRAGSKVFYELLEEMAETHDQKSHDYASDDNPFGNYEFAGKVSVMFAHSPFDAGFAGRLAEKIYRIANLESSDKVPKNETIVDTERDICVIVTLWMAARRERRSKSFNDSLKED